IQTMAIQPDGKILLAGYGNDGNNYDNFLLVRLNTNGSIDSSFDGDGKLLISVGSFNDRAYSIAIQSDGKVLLAGGSAKSYYNANFDFSVVRLHNNGSLDSSFGTNGKMLIPITFANDYVNSIAIQPDGKILLAGKID
ncbi:delta-60 repeat domain-containing protein, partial [Xanthomonas citri pv. citri]